MKEMSSQRSSLKQIEGTNQFTCVLFHKPLFVVSSSVVSFYFPLVLMIVLYGKVFLKIRSQNALWSQRTVEKENKSETDNKKNSSTVNLPLLTVKEDANLNRESIVSINELGK